ncbi:hypothetical protein SEPCBS57363_002898 [Sporothrix epigloea]|uniref:Red-like protein n=1 Tax=Sporothrix epigloea TaxID=1892477 RepID=A0ABP0DK41_9PEZI
MNNEQFRKLAFGSGASVPASSSNGPLSSTPRALGSRQKASIPMTPRYGDVGRVAFARQMAERYGTNNEAAIETKKVRTTKPRGTQFTAGYVDRAKLRAETEKIDGEPNAVSTASKGLDFQQLERARRGDVGGEDRPEKEDGTAEKEEVGAGVDDEFERIETADIQAIEHVKSKKRGQYSTAPPAAGQKRSRDQILAEMKAAREAAKQAKIEQSLSQPALGSRFKKIGTAPRAGSRIEVDSRGREVLILVDEDGHKKRKVRKVKKSTPTEEKPDGHGKVLGMEVPEFYRKKLEAEAAAAAAKEVDIFDDVGSDYDPLAGMDSDSSDGEADKEVDENKKKTIHDSSQSDGDVSDASSRSHSRIRPPIEGTKGSTKGDKTQDRTQPARPPCRNYFGASTLLSETTSLGGPLLQDPSVLGALRKAKQMREASEAEAQTQARSEEAAREARLQKLLQSSERDAEDLDMGFGSSRLEDTEDLDEAAGNGKKVRLSTWKGGTGGERQQIDGDDDDDDAGGSRGDKGKRKRGAKKRKGDGNNAEDVMRVLERRREQERS